VTQQLPLDLNGASPADRSKIARVLAIIRVHVGRDRAISMHEIAARTGVSTRDIQDIVKTLVEERSIPIGSATTKPYGYYVIRSEKELEENYQHFVRRGVSNIRHARAFNKPATIEDIVRQVKLEIEAKS
jgi:hypothetical protein